MDEKELMEILIRDNPEFKRAYEEHRMCKKSLEALNSKPFLSEAEQIEEKELKKKKLTLKDSMYRMMLEYRKTH